MSHKNEHRKENELEKDEPITLQASDADPVFPTESEYEIDEGGSSGSGKKRSGMVWIGIAIAAVIILCLAFALAGDWMSPQEASVVQDAQTNSQIVPEDE